MGGIHLSSKHEYGKVLMMCRTCRAQIRSWLGDAELTSFVVGNWRYTADMHY